MNQRPLKVQLLLGGLAMVLAFPAATYAFGGGGGPCGMREACGEYVDAFCPDARGPDEVHGCLREHEAELSDTCLAKLQEVQERHAAVRAACKSDVSNLCPGAETQREFHRCLRFNRDSLSDACSEALDSLPQRHRRWRKG